MKNSREQILNDAITDANEKTFSPGLTLRRIGVREELLLEMSGNPFLSPEVLKTLADGTVPAQATLQHAQEMLFICCTPPATTRELLRAGRNLFEDAVFAFLEKIPSREVEAEMITYLLRDLLGIKAASFDVLPESDGSAGKNVPSPAA